MSEQRSYRVSLDNVKLMLSQFPTILQDINLIKEKSSLDVIKSFNEFSINPEEINGKSYEEVKGYFHNKYDKLDSFQRIMNNEVGERNKFLIS